jgi:hypothetical protein
MIACQEPIRHDTLIAALNSVVGMEAQAVRPGYWTLAGGRAGEPAVIVELAEDRWLQFTTTAPAGRFHGAAAPGCAWDLLIVNGNLAGAAKFVLPPGSDRVTALRELWLEGEACDNEADEAGTTVSAARVREAVDDLEEAMENLRGDRSNRAGKAAPEGPAQEVDLPGLCHLAGWPWNGRAEGRIAVPLDVPGSYAQAILFPGCRVRATVELPLGQQGLSSLSRQAVGSVLLRLAGRVRWVRSAVHAGAEGQSAVLEAQLGPAPSAAALNHLLAALSVATRMTIRELPALACPEVAEKYLTIRGWSP